MKVTNFPTLFKMTSNGKTQQWNIVALRSGTYEAVVRVTYGHVDGKQQTTETKIKAGKSIGRANETTAYEQAILEASAKWKKQQDKGYGESAVVAKPKQKPMLAHKYQDHCNKVDWSNAWAQPKLDGIRCIARWEDDTVKLYSRGNKPILTMGHIVKQLIKIMRPDLVLEMEYPHPSLDGELYIHNEDFQNIVSWVKREQPNSLKVEYHVYDVIDTGPFINRFTFAGIRSMASSLQLPNIKEVSPIPVDVSDDLKRAHDDWIQDGYEGAILRWGDCLYKSGYRSQQLLKYKAFDDDEFEIIGAKEGKGRFEGMCVFQMKTKSGGVFECLPKGTAECRREYWENRDSYIGKFMTVRYFGMSTSEVPLPRFPIGITIRCYE